MTINVDNDKELLLKDLCARLLYEVILLAPNGKTTYETDSNTAIELFVDEGWKPYLRSLSSMTKEEEEEFQQLVTECDKMPTFNYVSIEYYRIFDWLNAHRFDYRGLIERGLAVDATGLGIY